MFVITVYVSRLIRNYIWTFCVHIFEGKECVNVNYMNLLHSYLYAQIYHFSPFKYRITGTGKGQNVYKIDQKEEQYCFLQANLMRMTCLRVNK